MSEQISVSHIEKQGLSFERPATKRPSVEEKRHHIHEEIEHPDKVSFHGDLGEQIDDVPVFTSEQSRKTLRKIDYRLVPFLTSLYIISFVDRGNIGNARVAGLVEDLHLTGMRWNIVLTMFFIPYTLLEVPSNIVLKMLRPSIWISVMMFCWGLSGSSIDMFTGNYWGIVDTLPVMTLMGIVQSYQGFIVARLALGIAESGFYPAATFILTLWYLRFEVQSRMVFYQAGACLAGAFSGLLAYAISFMHGIAGLEGWRWIFILEGIFTVLVSITVYFVLADDPLTCSFLTPLEKEWVVGRLQQETGSGRGRVTNDDAISWPQIRNALTEWRIWATIPIFWGSSIGVYGFQATIPTVIKQLGYSAANAQLLTVPIYVVAMIFTVLTAFVSDRYKQRSPFIIISYCVAACGFVALLVIPHPKYPGLTYGFLFMAATGLYMPLCPTVAWIANNLAPSSKRAVGMALLICGGNMGGIAGSNIYLIREQPRYWTGYGFSLAMVIFALIMTVVVRHANIRENARRDALSPAEIAEHYSEDDLLVLGDRSPYFRYVI